MGHGRGIRRGTAGCKSPDGENSDGETLINEGGK